MTAPHTIPDPRIDPPLTRVEFWSPEVRKWVFCACPPVDVLEDLTDGWGGLALGAETWGRDDRTCREYHYRVNLDLKAMDRRDECRAQRDERIRRKYGPKQQ